MPRHLVLMDRTTHAVAPDGWRYTVGRPLAELEQQLDPPRFFRTTRQVNVAAHGVRRYAAAGQDWPF